MACDKRAASSARVLRVGVVQQGRVVEERLFSAAQSVRIGSSPRCDIVLAPGRVPSARLLFRKQRGTWQLCLDPSDQGRVAQGGMQDLSDLISAGATRITLDRRARGKLDLGEVSVLFQLIPAPVAQLEPGSFRARLVGPDDPLFLGLLGAFSALAAVTMVWVMQQPLVERITLKDLPPEVTRLVFQPAPERVLPERHVELDLDAQAPPEPVPTLAQRVEAPERSEALAPQEPQGGRSALGSDRAYAEQTVAEALDLFIMGTRGEGSRAQRVAGVMGPGDDAGLVLERLLEAQGGVELAGVGVVIKDRRALGFDGPQMARAQVHDTVVTDRAPRVRVRAETPRGPSVPKGASADLNKALKIARTQVQTCYELSLNRNPRGSGRVELTLELFDGSVMDARVGVNQLDDPKLSACIVGKAMRWSFPVEAEGEFLVPYVLVPGS